MRPRSALLLALCPALQIAAFVPGAGSPWRQSQSTPPAVSGCRGARHWAPCRRAAGASAVRMGDLPGGSQGSGPGDEDDLERVVLKTSAPGPQAEQVQWEKRVLEATRRSALGALSLSTLVGYVKIYGESEESLRLYDSIDAALRRATGRPLAGVTQERVRAALDPSFAALVADAIEHVATVQLQLVDGAALRSEETAIAAKAVRLFPVADPASVSQAIEGGGWSALQHTSPSTSNLALYSRLRALEARLPSPKSRKEFSSAVGARILQQLRARSSDLDEAIQECVDAGARDCDLWLAALETLLGLYSAAGYGVAAIGENGTGLLDRLTWREDSPMTGTLSVFVYLIVFNDAAQVLAGEAVDDLAAALLPGPVLAAFFDCLGIEADAQSFYLSSRYRRNPADYRPDSVALVLNLSA